MQCIHKNSEKMEKNKAAKAVASVFSDDFKQQRLRAWRPLFTPGPVLTLLWIVGAVLVGISIAVMITDQNVREIVIPYDQDCEYVEDGSENESICEINLPLEVPLRLPVYVYYELDNFYQNYRLYAKSRNQDQLEGKNVSVYSELSDCAPRESFNHSKNQKDFYFPCGLIAWSQFTDTFELFDNESKPIKMRKEGIAWRSDVEMYNHDPGDNVTGIRVVENITDEDFLVWMRVAAFPNFRKLYRIIDSLPNATELSGTIKIVINNTFNVTDFGNKSLVLTELSWLGGKNNFIGYLFAVVGAIYLVFAIVFTAKQIFSPRRFADKSLLPWNTNEVSGSDGENDDDEYANAEIVEVAQTHISE